MRSILFRYADGVSGASTGGMNVGAVPSYYWDVTPQFNFVMSKIMSMSSKIKRLAQSVD